MNKKAAELGFIGGLICIAIGVFSYSMGVGFMANWTYGLCMIGVYIIMDVLLSLRLKKVPAEEVTYGQAFGGIMIYMITAGLLTTLYSAILFHVIDPELPQKLHDATIQNTISFMESMGTPQDKIDETIDSMKFDPAQYSAPKLVLGLLVRLVWYAIFASIMAIFVRKQKPLFDNTSIDQPAQ
jgi:hypothetical protein